MKEEESKNIIAQLFFKNKDPAPKIAEISSNSEDESEDENAEENNGGGIIRQNSKRSGQFGKSHRSNFGSSVKGNRNKE
jgi:hypothetical protein